MLVLVFHFLCNDVQLTNHEGSTWKMRVRPGVLIISLGTALTGFKKRWVFLIPRDFRKPINQSIFIPPKIKRHILEVGSLKSHKTYCIQIIERSKIISKNKPVYKNILKSISLYLRAMSTFVSELILCFFLLRNDVTKRAVGINWTYLEKLLIYLF